MNKLKRSHKILILLGMGLMLSVFAFDMFGSVQALAMAPPAPNVRGKQAKIPLNTVDKIRGALNKIGYETAFLSGDKNTFNVSYEIPSLDSDSAIAESLVSIFSVLGILDKQDTTFTATPYEFGRDKPFATFIVQAKDARLYVQDKMTLNQFVATFTTKEDKKKFQRSCASTYLHSHEDAAQGGTCVCDAGYHNAENEVCNADAVQPPTPTVQNPYVNPPTNSTPVVEPKVTPPIVQTPSTGVTVTKGRTTLKSENFPGDGEAFSFDNGVSVRPHWYDFDLEYIYNADVRNPSFTQANTAAFIPSNVSFDAMTTAPSHGYCGLEVTPTSEADPCNNINARVGSNYYIRTFSGGMVKDSNGKTVALGGKIRYAKIHVVSVSPTSATFDWVFQPQEGNTNLH